MPSILRLCGNCKHKRTSEDGDEWEWCDRPNYPEGKNWNRLTSVQRYSMDMEDSFCNGKYHEDA